ncbi:hypothetical protein Mapa_016792 [Marchantia paleacea]|nr:hypothetical protein Mapa_016792 [Marchantia paleacea]
MRIFLVLCLLLCWNVPSCSAKTTLPRLETTRKFLIFGDFYADTGYTQNTTAWGIPYGMTFPGEPFGRFSNGLVETDFIASKVLHVALPPAYAKFLANTSTSISLWA